MRAIGRTSPLSIDHPESLVDFEAPLPEPQARDLVVEVRAIAVNPVDSKIRLSRPAAPSPQVLGWDAAGIVVDAGPEATMFRRGDEVYFAGDITRPGCNSEYCLVDERIVAWKPRRLDFAEAAAMPLTTLTAYEGLFDRLRLPRGEASRGRSLLVVGGAGGVGSIAIQLAKQLTRATVIATAGRPESTSWVQEMGADHVLDHRRPLAPQLRALGTPAVDYVFCTADTDVYFEPLAEIVAPQGTVGFIVNARQPVNLTSYQAKSITIAWELMFTRSMFHTPDMLEQHRLLYEVAGLIDAGRVRTTLTSRLAPICARTLREAHARIESGATIGKIALERWS